MDGRPTRRALLGAAVLGGVTACLPERARQRTADPDAALLEAARRDEQVLIAAYDALIASHPGRAALLAPLREEHRAHLNAVGGSTTATSAGTSRGRSPVDLVGSERAAARDRAAAARRAGSPQRAQLLASIAAAEAAHADLLAGLRG